MLLSGLQGEVRIHHTDAQLIHNDEQQRSSGFPPQFAKKVKVKVVQSCPTLCDPMDYTVHGILQVRLLEWAAFPFSSGSFWPRNWTGVSCTVGRFFTNWAITITLMYVQRREKAMAPHSSTVAWKIPWTEGPGRLQSMGSLRVGYDWATSLSLSTFMHWRRKWQPTPVFLPGESHGQRSLVGCSPWGRRESDTTEAT